MPALRLLAGPVALCIVAVACGYTAPTGTSNNNPPPTPNATSDINIVVGAQNKGTSAFSPNPKNLSLSGGGSVRWINGDISGGDYTMGTAVTHDIVSDNDAFPSSGNLTGNAQYSITLATPGDYAYHCGIHPSMKGTIHVTP